MELSFWKEKKVFVTGHTGFKGSWLCLWLKKLGADVVGYALEPSTSPSLFQEAGVESGMTSVIGDIRDRVPALQGRPAQTENTPDVGAESILRFPIVRNRNPNIRPCSVEKADHSVIE